MINLATQLMTIILPVERLQLLFDASFWTFFLTRLQQAAEERGV
jgi:hypothetical protein